MSESLKSLKGWFRRVYGYDEQHRCKDCANLWSYQTNRKLYKCKKMGESRSATKDTDIRLFACALYEPRERSEDD